ncbi:MAG: hypothetical protein H6752_05950 [Candidatus Omnitrophica bacterium]|nr:hypothetical protein [Candidatus Omnitrophota bacterium]
MYAKNVKITVEFSDFELEDIQRITGERKKGPAIRKLVADALMMRKREEIAQKFISGKWGADLEGFEEGRRRDREEASQLESEWRD